MRHMVRDLLLAGLRHSSVVQVVLQAADDTRMTVGNVLAKLRDGRAAGLLHGELEVNILSHADLLIEQGGTALVRKVLPPESHSSISISSEMLDALSHHSADDLYRSCNRPSAFNSSWMKLEQDGNVCPTAQSNRDLRQTGGGCASTLCKTQSLHIKTLTRLNRELRMRPIQKRQHQLLDEPLCHVTGDSKEGSPVLQAADDASGAGRHAATEGLAVLIASLGQGHVEADVGGGVLHDLLHARLAAR